VRAQDASKRPIVFSLVRCVPSRNTGSVKANEDPCCVLCRADAVDAVCGVWPAADVRG
jgi:hypothetical protein